MIFAVSSAMYENHDVEGSIDVRLTFYTCGGALFHFHGADP